MPYPVPHRGHSIDTACMLQTQRAAKAMVERHELHIKDSWRSHPYFLFFKPHECGGLTFQTLYHAMRQLGYQLDAAMEYRIASSVTQDRDDPLTALVQDICVLNEHATRNGTLRLVSSTDGNHEQTLSYSAALEWRAYTLASQFSIPHMDRTILTARLSNAHDVLQGGPVMSVGAS